MNVEVRVLKIEEQEFMILDPLGYFDRNIDNAAAHNRFFESLTPYWHFFLNQGRHHAGAKVWEFALQIAYEWEAKNKGERIHKGTPYYFGGVTAILNDDLENGFLFMHQALEEDQKTEKTDSPQRPAFFFVTLDHENEEQFFKPKVLEISTFVNDHLDRYRTTRDGSLTLSDLQTKFLKNRNLQTVVFYFVFEAFRLKRLQVEIDRKLQANTFSSLLQANILFSLTLIIDNVIKQQNSGEWRFSDHLEFLSTKTSLSLNDDKIKNELSLAFKNNKFSSTLKSLLDSTFHFKDGTSPLPIETDLAISYGIRNYGAHRIEDQVVVYENFDDIARRLLNALFFAVERLY
jgi:hypothetical protein